MLVDNPRSCRCSHTCTVFWRGKQKAKCGMGCTTALEPKAIIVAADDATAENPFRGEHMRRIGLGEDLFDAEAIGHRLHCDEGGVLRPKAKQAARCLHNDGFVDARCEPLEAADQTLGIPDASRPIVNAICPSTAPASSRTMIVHSPSCFCS
jgi:hypothetical protein